jgi:DNA-binding response OmpR family regulator
VNRAPTLLIIDDDEGTLQTFAKVLALEGYDIRTALSPQVGLQEAEMANPDAILLDLRMPFINGLGFLYRLRARPEFHDVPVAIVTGDPCVDDAMVKELQELGAHIKFKPLWIEDLVRLARTLLSKPEPGSALAS